MTPVTSNASSARRTDDEGATPATDVEEGAVDATVLVGRDANGVNLKSKGDEMKAGRGNREGRDRQDLPPSSSF